MIRTKLALVLGCLLLAGSARANPAMCPPNCDQVSPLDEVIGRINAGQTFRIRLDFNIGTMVAGQIYTVNYNRFTQGFTMTGYSSSRRAINTATYRGTGLQNAQVSLWGGTFSFDEFGNLYYRGQSLVGVLQL